MLAVVERQAVALDRVGGAAQARAHLEHDDLRAGLGEVERGGDAGQAAAHDRDACALAHRALPARLRAASPAFCQVDSEIRRCVTSSGSCSMRLRMRR